MIFHHVVYEISTGRIVRAGSGTTERAPDDLHGCDPSTHALLPIKADIKTQYIANGEAVDMGPRPSDHHIFDFTTKEWTLDLDAARSSAWARVKKARDVEIASGVGYEGHIFDSCEQSMHRMMMCAQAVQASQDSTVAWTLADNSSVIIHATDILRISSLMWTRFQALFAKGQRLREQIQQATTQAQLGAISW